MRHRLLALPIVAVALVVAVSPVAAGRPNLVSNGTFDSDLSGWTLQGSCEALPLWQDTASAYGPVIKGGAAYLNACGGDPRPAIFQTVTVENGKEYRISGIVYSCSEFAFHDFDVTVGGTPLSVTYGRVTSTDWTLFTADFTAGSTSAAIGFEAEDLFDICSWVDNLAVRAKR